MIYLLSPSGALGAVFTIGLTGSPDPVTAGNTLTYTINIINSSLIFQSPITVSDTLPGTVQFQSANPTNFVNNGGVVTFVTNGLAAGQSFSLTVAVTPQTAGSITNFVTVTSSTVTEGTNVVTTVSAQLATNPDLALTLTQPASPVIVNDWVGYTVTVTNRGPGSASAAVLSNSFSLPILLRALSPSNNISSSSTTNLVLNVGALDSGAATAFQLQVQPTNNGTLTLSANVTTSGTPDTNSANNSASTSVTVDAPGPPLVATTNSIQNYNPQTGLMEQTVSLSNPGTSSVASARVILTNFPHRVYNAVGTNDGNPFVEYTGTLTNGQSVDLLLEYFIPTRTAVPDPGLMAYGVPAVGLTTSTNGATISVVKLLAGGRVLIEFPSELGRNYLSVYSDDAGFTNAFKAQPSITAPANRVQWIDDGPPKTISRPADQNSRFYRVIAQ